MRKEKYERVYYLIGPFDVIYGKFEKLQQAKNHILDMSLSGSRVHILKPCIYKSCDQPAYEYDRASIKYIEQDQVWAYIYYTWEDWVEDTLKPFRKKHPEMF